LIRWIRAFIDSAALFGRPVTSASRNAVNREPGSAQGVVARARLAALRTARLAAVLEEVLEEVLDRADRDEGCRCGITLTKACRPRK